MGKSALADCKHPEEKVVGIHQGETLASCPTCGQTRRYIEGKEDSTVITKLGRIAGAIVMPPVAVSLSITPEESRLVREGWDIMRGTGKVTSRRAVELLPSVERQKLEAVAEEKEEEAPPPQLGTKKPHFDKRREKILADYGQMTIADLERKWKMARGYWYILKRRWENEGITIPTAYADRAPEESPPTSFKPPNWDQLDKNQKCKFYNENKDYILKTIEELGRLPALEKLDIHPGTYYRLLERWELKPQGRKKKSPRKITGRAELVEAKRLTKEPAPEPTAPFRTGPLNKRHGIRALWRF